MGENNRRVSMLSEIGDGAIIGFSDGTLARVTRQFLEQVQPVFDTETLVYHPEIPVSMIEQDTSIAVGRKDWEKEIQVPIQKHEVGGYYIHAGYHADPDVWLVIGEPEPIPT